MPKKIDTNNSLLEVYPDIAKEWDYQKNEGLLPSEVAPKSHKKVWWICLKCGYEWMAAISNRTGRNTGCPFCGRGVEPECQPFGQTLQGFSVREYGKALGGAAQGG